MLLNDIKNIICKTLVAVETNGLSIIRKNVAWEKWFQCMLFAVMNNAGVETYCESCMDDEPHKPGTRNDFLVIDQDKKVMLIELKCRSNNQNINSAINGFCDDISKLLNFQTSRNVYGSYKYLCILLYEVKTKEEIEIIQNRMKIISSDLTRYGWNLYIEQVDGIESMYIAMAYPNM